MVQLIRANLEPQIGTCFAEELKTESREGNRAWRAYQRLVLDALLAGVTGLDQKQDQILAMLEAWECRWEVSSEEGRERTGEAGLQQTVNTAADRVITTLAEQFSKSEQVTGAWSHATWSRITTELQATEDRIVVGVLQGIDERLANPSQAAPQVRSRIREVPHHSVTIQLSAHNGQFLCAEGGDGREVVANRNAGDRLETFTLWQVLGPGPFRSCDQTALQAANGQ